LWPHSKLTSTPAIMLASAAVPRNVSDGIFRDIARLLRHFLNAWAKFKRLFKIAAGQKQGIFLNFCPLW
jgi:hypothetical protein